MYSVKHIWKYSSPVFIEALKAKSNTTRSIKSPYKKTSKVYFYVGCSYENLRKHIEKQFLKNMSWENHGEWHIDHIKPISKFEKTDDTSIVNSLENLRPLWAIDNLKKSNKYE